MRWLVDEWEWPYAGTLAAVFLLALLPLWWDATDTALALVYAVLPLYMLHQLEVIALWLAYHVELAMGLLPVYLMGVNAVTHIGAAAAARAYNPGLWTAILVFIPVSIWAAVEIGDTADAGLGWQLTGLAFGLAVHAAIMGYIAVARRA